jgi:hypothetical protein
MNFLGCYPTVKAPSRRFADEPRIQRKMRLIMRSLLEF